MCPNHEDTTFDMTYYCDRDMPLMRQLLGRLRMESLSSKNFTGIGRITISYAAGSLYSTLDDLYKWDQAVYRDAVFPEKYKAIMFQPRLENYALGW